MANKYMPGPQGQAQFYWDQMSPNLDSLLQDLEGSRFYDLAKNDSNWLREVGDINSVREKYLAVLNMLNGYKRQLSDEQYAEGEIGRNVKAQIAAGINPDLAGLASGNGFLSGENRAAGIDPSSQAAPFNNPFERLEGGLNAIGSAFSFAKQVAGAVTDITGFNLDSAQKLFDLISQGKGMYDDVRESFRGSDAEDLHGQVMDTLFGSDGRNGLLSGAIPSSKLKRVREALDSYGSGVQSGTADKVAENVSELGLTESRRAKRESAHKDAAEAASGLYETEGELFKIQVQGMKEQTVNELKKVRLEQELAILQGKHDLERVSLLDPSLEAMASNETQRAVISEAGYNVDYFDNLDGAKRASAENAESGYWSDYYSNKDGMTDAQRENRINEIQEELTTLNAKADKIVLNTELKALNYLDKHGVLLYQTTRQGNKVNLAHEIRSGRQYSDGAFSLAKETVKDGARGFSSFLSRLIK